MSNALVDAQEAPRIPRDTFSARLVLLRHELEMTVDQISSRCEIPAATWSTWERGTTPRNVNLVCKAIAEKTGYDLSWLAFGGFPLRAKRELSLIHGGSRDADATARQSPLLTLCD